MSLLVLDAFKVCPFSRVFFFNVNNYVTYTENFFPFLQSSIYVVYISQLIFVCVALIGIFGVI